MTHSGFRQRRLVLCGMVAVAVTLAGCGSRQPHAAFVAANEGGVLVPAGSVAATAAPDQAGAGSGDLTTGGSTAAPTAPGADAAATAPVPSDVAAAPAVPVAGGPATLAPVPVTASTGRPSVVAGATPRKSAAAKASTKPGQATAATGAGKTTAATNRCATSGSTVVLGNISTQSGLLGALFAGVPQALQVWAAQANACGGFGGHPVKVISLDDGGDPNTALSDAQTLVQSDGAIALVGVDQPISVSGEASYLQQAGVPEIGGDSSESQFFDNPVFFPIGPFVSVIGAADASLAISKGATKIAVLYCTEIPNTCGSTAASEYLQAGSPTVQKMGGSVVLYEQASLTAPSYTSQCLQAQNDGATAIIAILDGPSIGRLATDCSQQGYNPIYLGVSLGLSANLNSYSALTKNNFFAPLNTFPWTDSSVPATAAYQAAVAKYYGKPLPGPSPAMVYASGVLAQTAVSGGLPANPTSADVLKDMYTIKNQTLGGLTAPLTFDPTLPRNVPSCYFDTAITNGEFASPDGDTCVTVDAAGPSS